MIRKAKIEIRKWADRMEGNVQFSVDDLLREIVGTRRIGFNTEGAEKEDRVHGEE
jgi:hypothetical protein